MKRTSTPGNEAPMVISPVRLTRLLAEIAPSAKARRRGRSRRHPF
jgi:hypothetical protein